MKQEKFSRLRQFNKEIASQVDEMKKKTRPEKELTNISRQWERLLNVWKHLILECRGSLVENH
jgi:hypothetical protein